MRTRTSGRAIAIALTIATAALAPTTLTALPAVAAPAVAAPAVAAATPVVCGSTLTTSTALTADLHCTGDGAALTLVGGATLDLGGHTLSGPGATVGAGTSAGVAISGVASAAPATVKNGTITGFALGINSGDSVEQAVGVVQNVTLTRNTNGLFALFSRFTVSSSRIIGNVRGLNALYSFVTVTGSAVRENTESGVVIFSSGGLTISRTTFHHNGVAVNCGEVALSITGSTFTANTIGVRGFSCEGATLRGNRFVSNTTAYSSTFGPDMARDELIGNHFVANATAVAAGVSTHLRGNTFVSNKTALRAVAEYDFIADTVTMEKNYFTLNTDAVYVTMPARIQSTVAIKNSGYGIYAPNATDLGGNIARLNGREPQCTGVVCR